MLIVRYSHQMSALADDFVHRQRQRGSDPLLPETVIVQSNGLAQWLRMRIADQYGICANISFPFVSSYLWQLVRQIPALEIPVQTPFDKPQLVWRLLALMKDADVLAAFPELAAYLVGKDAEARFHFAYQLADVYDQYQLYRPGWLPGEQPLPGIARASQSHTAKLPDSHRWQGALWQRLRAEIEQPTGVRVATRLDWLGQLPQHLNDLQDYGRLPDALTIFGINTLPPVLLQLYVALSTVVPITLYMLNPSEMYWGDQQSPRELGRQLQDPADLNALLESQNPLLASMGRLGRDFLDQLIELEANGQAMIEEVLLEPTDRDKTANCPSILVTLQQQMIAALPPSALPFPAAQLSTDTSIEIASHYRPMREVQALHDRLLDWLQRPGIEPADILILTADIDTYAPLIKQYFQAVTPSIPFSVADKPDYAQQHARELIMAILALPNTRGTLADVMALLTHPLIESRFIPDTIDVHRYPQLFYHAGVRWGLNDAQRQAFGTSSAEGSWTAAWQALMSSHVYADSVTLPGLSEHYQRLSDGELWEQLRVFWPFYQLLDSWVNDALRPTTLADWVSQLSRLLAALTVQDSSSRHEQAALATLIAGLQEMLDHLPASLQAETIELNAFRAYVETLWPENEGQRGFLSGGVTIASMVPMRTIPSKIIGFLGLNDGVFPRQHHPSDLDASAHHYRPGDRNRRLDDRYLFIETLISAEQHLYISYLGRDPVKNQPQPPSPVVTELIDVIARSAGLSYAKTAEQLIREYPLQAFSPANFTATHGCYQPRYYQMASQLHRGAHVNGLASAPIWELAPTTEVSSPEDDAVHPISQTLSLSTLQQFWQNPGRTWLAHAVGAQSLRQQVLFPDVESIEMDPLSRAQIAQEHGYLLRASVSSAAASQLLSLRHLTPVGIHGDAVSAHYQHYQEAFSGFPAAPVHREIRLTLGATTLYGQVMALPDAGAIDLIISTSAKPTATNIDPRALFRGWLNHLLVNAEQGERAGQFWVIGEQSAPASAPLILSGLPSEQARTELVSLIEGYQHGQQVLLHWLPQIAASYCQAREAGQHEAKIRAAMQKTFMDKWQYHDLLPILYPDKQLHPIAAWQANAERYYQPMLDCLERFS